jgi:predicted amidophosphoribosyltransferase
MRLSRIDEMTRREHYYLGDQDVCFYLGEYAAGKGGAHGMTSVLVHDLLQPRDASVPKQEYRKDRALGSVAQWLHEAFDPGGLGGATFVPMPQSGSGLQTDNDDRIYRILRRTAEGLDIRRMIELTGSMTTGEYGSLRSGPNVLYEHMQVVLAATEPQPRVIFLVDDVLATGANFVAAKRRILQVLPHVPVFGLFIARKARESGDILNH